MINAVVIAVILMIILCLCRLNVVISLFISALVGGLISGMNLEKVINVLEKYSRWRRSRIKLCVTWWFCCLDFIVV